jgi:multisubunit Na+/H+ antiporter MnhF subunit
MIWILVLLLVLLAVFGGVAVSKFLFFLLLAALVLALFGFIGGRSTT